MLVEELGSSPDQVQESAMLSNCGKILKPKNDDCRVVKPLFECVVKRQDACQEYQAMAETSLWLRETPEVW